MKEADVSYLTDDPAPQYGAELDATTGINSLRAMLRTWSWCASDAARVAKRMTDREWSAFIAGLKKERRGIFAGEKWATRYGAILIPEAMMRTSITAQRFGAPWGCAWIRLREMADKKP